MGFLFWIFIAVSLDFIIVGVLYYIKDKEPPCQEIITQACEDHPVRHWYAKILDEALLSLFHPD